MELSDKAKIHIGFICPILVITLSSFFADRDDKLLHIIGGSCFVLLYIIVLIFTSNRYKKYYIKRKYPNIYSTYLNPPKDKQHNLFKAYKSEPLYTIDFLINSSFNTLHNIEEDIKRSKDPEFLEMWMKEHQEKVDKAKAEIMNLIYATNKNAAWYNQALLYIEKLNWKVPLTHFPNKKERLTPVVYPLIYFPNEIALLLNEISNYKKYSLTDELSSTSTLKNFSDDITYDDIINKEVEFNDDSIYVRKKVWDGVKYTIK
ncbi:MAG: hypothetical protein K2L60_03420, partial [Bacteroides sp.]|nr:hypothetical protein [Bacteroides sp.]